MISLAWAHISDVIAYLLNTRWCDSISIELKPKRVSNKGIVSQTWPRRRCFKPQETNRPGIEKESTNKRFFISSLPFSITIQRTDRISVFIFNVITSNGSKIKGKLHHQWLWHGEDLLFQPFSLLSGVGSWQESKIEWNQANIINFSSFLALPYSFVLLKESENDLICFAIQQCKLPKVAFCASTRTKSVLCSGVFIIM